MSCTYTYKGNTYTYQEIKEIIPVEKETVNSEAAKQWLADKLNMTKDEVSVVKGLIENKALGQIQEDGKILLSEEASESIGYHEAFHRVFRLFVKPQERARLTKEFKQRKDAKALMKLYAEEYKGLSEEDLIEEILAEEFREYVLTNQATKPANKSLWDRIIEWLQKLFNIKSNKDFTIKELYAKINEAGFKDAAKLPKEYIKSGKANMLSFNFDNKALNLSEKETKDLMEGLNYSFFQTMLNENYNPYTFSEGFKAKVLYDKVFGDIIAKLKESSNPRSKELAEALLLEDNLKEVRKLHAKYIKELGFVSEEFDESEVQQRNTPDWVNAVEISSKEKMSKQIKMLLSAVPAAKKEGNKIVAIKNDLGLPYQKNNKDVIDLLLNKLAGIPATPENFINELRKIKDDHPEVAFIVNYIGGVKYDPLSNPLWKNRLRVDFVQAFAKTKYEFLVQLIKNDGRIVNISANEDATSRKILRQWQSNLEIGLKDNFYQRLDAFRLNDMSALADTLGISLHPSLLQDAELMKDLKAIAVHLLENKDKLKPLDIYNPKIDSKLKVEGRLNKLAKAQLPFSDVIELQVLNSDNKPVYSIALNTYQTLVTDMINYYGEQGLEKLKEKLPFLFNFYTNNSLVLNEVIKNKKKIVYSLQDGTKNEFGDSVSSSRPSETTLLQNAINNLFVDGANNLKGVFTSIKHADRGVFPVYGFNDGTLLINDNFLPAGVDAFVGYLKDEVSRAKNAENLESLNILHYSGKVKERGIFTDYIDTNTWNRAILSPDFTKDADLYNTIKKQIQAKIEAEIKANTQALEKYGLLKSYGGTKSGSKDAKRHVGIDNKLLAKFDGKLNELVTAYTVNDLLWKVEQIKIYTGEVLLYKNMEEFYKRLNTQSSSGEVAVVDKETNDYVTYMNDETYTKYGIRYNKTINGKVKNVTLADGTFTSGQTDKIYDVLFDHFKDKTKAEAYTKPYLEYTEPDGFSYINLFELREFLYRSGKWSDGHQQVFDKEMQILKLMRDGANEPTIKAKINELYTLKDELGNNIDANTYLEDILQPFVIEKPQYAGAISYDADYATQPNITGVLKTAFLPLIPSIIYNSNLAKINDKLINQGTGIYGYSSTSKVGIFNPNDAYVEKDGKFVLNEDFGQPRELDYRFMKLQLAISHIPKDRIISSTQSTKMMMQDIYSEGKPRDFKGTVEEWANLSKEDKLAQSELHSLIEDYQELFSELVDRNSQELIQELEAIQTEFNDFKPSKYQLNKIDTLKEVLKRQAESRSEPQAILDAIDSFVKGDFIEGLPNSNKLWSIIFSLVSSKIRLKRAGTAMPQAASTMFESGPREIVEINKKKLIKSSDFLKFYEPIRDDQGNLTGIEPAEMIMPLPTEWIEPAFKKYAHRLTNKRSLPELIDIINDEIAKGNITSLITTKSLRIPNQQFSSNDVLKVKKFTNPAAMQQMVIVPSEMVAKTGGDFDIDKLNIYFKNSDSDFEEIQYQTEHSEKAFEAFIDYKLRKELKDLKNSDAAYLSFKSRIENLKESLKEYGKEVETAFVENVAPAIEAILGERPKNAEEAFKLLRKAQIKYYNEIEEINKYLGADYNEDSSTEALKKKGKKFLPDFKEKEAERKQYIVAVRVLEENIKAIDNVVQVTKQDEADINKRKETALKAIKTRITNLKEAFRTDFLNATVIEINSKQAIENRLLDIETQILLHRANAFQLFAAVDDTLTKVNGFKAAKGVTYEKYKEEQAKIKSLSNVLSTTANMARTMEFMGGAIGIGIVATHSTNHSYGQVHNIEINITYYPEEYVGGKIVRNPKSTVIPFTIENSQFLGKTTNEVGDYISHIISALITSQVDMVKDPYASIMYITTQTFPTTLYMLRRGYSLETVVKFLKQPAIQKYMERERINQSPLYASTGKQSKKNPNGLQLSKADLMGMVILGLDKDQTQVTKFTQEILDSENPKLQKQLLQLFVNIREQAAAFDNFKVIASPDTKLLKTFEEAVEFEEIREDVLNTNIINVEKVIKDIKIIDSYNKLHNLYYGLFHSLALSEFPIVKAQMQLAKQLFKEPFALDKAAKLNIALTSSLMSYVLQKHTTAKNQFEKLFKGADSLPKKIAKMQKTTDNLAVKEITPLLNFQQEGVDLISLQNISYQPQELETLQREMLRLKESNEDIYNALVIMNLYQTAAGYNPKSITQIVPNEYNKKLNDEVMNFIKDGNVNYEEWLSLLPLALPNLLATQFDAKGKPYKMKTETGQKVVINDVTYDPIASPYYINWNQEVKEVPPTLVDATDEVYDYMLSEESNKNILPYYEGDIKPEPNTIFVFGSNPVGINGNPVKGTGGAALVASTQFGVKQGEKMDNKLSESGNAYGLTTVTYPGKKNSMSPAQITEGIKKLYGVAKQNPTKQFKIAYRNTTEKSLNGYTGLEMIEMFNNAGERPSNIIFSKEWVNTGKIKTQEQPIIEEDKPNTPCQGGAKI